LIDTHAHLNMAEFSDLSEVLKRASDVGVKAVIDVGFDMESSKRSLPLSSSYDNIYSAVGIHPHDAANVSDADMADIEKMADTEGVVAIGESGLDYFRNLSPKDKQIELLSKHVRLAVKKNLPLIIHSREAGDDVLRVVRQEGGGKLTGVMHCFAGDNRFASLCLDLGLYISFAGNITFPKAHELRSAAAYIPENMLLAETDSPYLAPQSLRGKRNEPANVIQVVAEIANVRKISPERLSERLYSNALTLFKKIRQ
jgi:TatD DNase family protein